MTDTLTRIGRRIEHSRIEPTTRWTIMDYPDNHFDEWGVDDLRTDMNHLLGVAREARQLLRVCEHVRTFGYVDVRDLDFQPLRDSLDALDAK